MRPNSEELEAMATRINGIIYQIRGRALWYHAPVAELRQAESFIRRAVEDLRAIEEADESKRQTKLAI